MKIITGSSEMQKIAIELIREGKSIGFVPTMGALHAGHISLVKESKKRNDITIASIFVNPAQFAPHEDLAKYPRPIERDQEMLIAAGVDYLFHPEPVEIYPDGYKTYVTVRELSDVLEGKTRPGHFTGVATVVTKLFNIVMPTNTYFGQKDLQQFLVVKKLIKDLNQPVNLVMMPIIRESDGLALSSRNVYLSPKERKDALALSQSLKLAEKLIKEGGKDAEVIRGEMKKHIEGHGSLKIDYIAICDPEGMSTIKIIKDNVAILVAAYDGKTRLIDNVIIKV
ncbi:MAG TPA: pantoate--beta-alanine ligase [Candidatus Saccharimonadales bacterium]|nr:pantoate--beta-alanine ligase [Candidatus Saccharimonadales bacterium]